MAKGKTHKLKHLYTKAEYQVVLAETQNNLQIIRALKKRKSTSEADKFQIDKAGKEIVKYRDALKAEYAASQLKFLKTSIDTFVSDLQDKKIRDKVTDFNDFQKPLSLRDILFPEKKNN
jgi:hypothetical protein